VPTRAALITGQVESLLLRQGKRLIVHADDFGSCASVNRATIAALESEAISSASVMAPCDYFKPAVNYAARHPEMDIGLHLTVTSERPAKRWGPVADREKVPSLIDEDGCFYADADVLSERARPEEVYIELKVQMERALAMGMKPTHVDTHMFALFYNDALHQPARDKPWVRRRKEHSKASRERNRQSTS